MSTSSFANLITTSTLPTQSSTFWIVDTTSVSDTFTVTTQFTLYVPLYTTSTTPTPTPSAVATPSKGAAPAIRSQTAIIIGTIVGCAVLAAIAVIFYFIYRVKHARPQFRLHQNDSSKALDSSQNSAHALLDLAAEPTPHPSNIEPWVAPTAVRRSGKIRPRDELTEHDEMTNEAPGEQPPTPAVEPLQTVPLSSHHDSDITPPRAGAGRTLQLVQHDSVASTSTSTPHNPKSMQLPASQPRRRRTQRDPSPPRLEEDAGVSLMRAGDEVPSPLADEPPSYNFASGSRS
ncbi:hypothetical protein FRC12_007868 [Ceratobasidium sp. 428]|nr:hypothetical protein FRC12_007868 [Ceratobasidium sp. 428]